MISGSIVAIVTPMNDQGEIDWESYQNLIEFHINQGTGGLVVIGTTGESATITPKEHVQCIAFVVKTVAGRIPVIAGTGANATQEAIHLAVKAQQAGANAHLSVAPYYNKPDQRGLLAHYQAITQACDLPLILYNVPSRTCSDLAVETVVELAKVPHIIGIKEASNLERCQQLLKAVPADFAVYSGHDPINCQIISEGAKGAISVTANVAPKAMAEICRLATTDYTQAQAIDETLQALHHDLFVEPSPAACKWILSQMGLIKNHLRLPLLPLSDKAFPVIEKALKQANISL